MGEIHRENRMLTESYGVIKWIQQADSLNTLHGWIIQCVNYISIKISSTYTQRKKNHKNLLCNGIWGGCVEIGKATEERVGGNVTSQAFSSVQRDQGLTRGFPHKLKLKVPWKPLTQFPSFNSTRWEKTFLRTVFPRRLHKALGMVWESHFLS